MTELTEELTAMRDKHVEYLIDFFAVSVVEGTKEATITDALLSGMAAGIMYALDMVSTYGPEVIPVFNKLCGNDEPFSAWEDIK